MHKEIKVLKIWRQQGLTIASGILLLANCVWLPPVNSGKSAVSTKYMISTANPLATKAGLEMLRVGGSAVDATIAAQMVLSLVEPQSSGIGGGAFLMHFDASRSRVESYDGRETAPHSAHAKMFIKNGKRMKFMQAAAGGTSVGVPGLVRMLGLAHREHGKLPWRHLFRPAIKLAETGFAISPRLAKLLGREKILRKTPAALGYFYTEGGKNQPIGTLIKNEALAKTLRKIADNGAGIFYQSEIAYDIVDTVRRTNNNPSGMTLDDVVTYQAVKRPPVCSPYRQWQICGMGPPSSGGLSIAQIFGVLEQFDLPAMKPTFVKAVHLVGEAGALAFADRNTYVADGDFIPVPINGMLDQEYLKSRAALISLARAGGKRHPGNPPKPAAFNFAPGDDTKGHSTSHISTIDADGNAVSMTTSIENVFGSRLMTGGFILNNQLTDFSFSPERGGKPVANRAAPGKRPRSSMSPTLVLDKDGLLVMAIGSPGGSRIIGYVAKTLVASLDWGMDMQAAIDLPYFLNRNGALELERGTVLEGLKPEFEKLGHTVKLTSRASGLHGIRVIPGGLQGGADKRREGVALGN